ncbi:MAG TPA: macro domain-containing protein, partial [Planctomycetaceae bacterium]|nr:macro domain-containing protein [Planctomycetaceae bacterium]
CKCGQSKQWSERLYQFDCREREMNPTVVCGDLLEQDVEVIVNPWNRNIIPWWLLLPQGVSGAIKRAGGHEPFRELAKFGPLKLGAAVETSAGRLSYESIIHVSGINFFWFATKYSIQESVRNAMKIVNEKSYASVAFPIIGSGSGNRSVDKCLSYMQDAFEQIDSRAEVRIVRFHQSK